MLTTIFRPMIIADFVKNVKQQMLQQQYPIEIPIPMTIYGVSLLMGEFFERASYSSKYNMRLMWLTDGSLFCYKLYLVTRYDVEFYSPFAVKCPDDLSTQTLDLEAYLFPNSFNDQNEWFLTLPKYDENAIANQTIWLLPQGKPQILQGLPNYREVNTNDLLLSLDKMFDVSAMRRDILYHFEIVETTRIIAWLNQEENEV